LQGLPCQTIWTDISPINSQSKERTGYPTQKPLALLKRIILASSNVGDVVLDPFCGCATTCVAAQQLDRKWIGIDIEKQAAKVLVERLSDDAGLFKDFVATDQTPKRSDLKTVLPSESVKERLYKEQKGKCNACGVDLEIRHLEIDHIIPKAKGGGDYYENYQLLCGSCNRIKGDRPMEYLRLKIETRERMMKTKIFFGE
jgi:site-specific DNA-methyltransferase (adenine-specific)